jgi:hypothetical protein
MAQDRDVVQAGGGTRTHDILITSEVLYQLSYSGKAQIVTVAPCPIETWPSRCCRHGTDMEHPKDVGDRTQLAVMLALQEIGYAVSLPFGENTRYDLVIDDGKSLSRVQCKTGRLRAGAVRWATCSFYGHHPNPRTRQRDYHGQVDYFAVFCPDTGKVYLVPIDDLPVRRQAALRVEPTKNGQKKGIRLAERYEVAYVGAATAGPDETSGA